MELDKYTSAFRADLLAAAALGDERTRETAAALGHAAEASARLMLLAALSEFADEVSELLDDQQVSVRVDGRDARGEIRSTRPAEPADASSVDDPVAGFDPTSAPHDKANSISNSNSDSNSGDDYPTMDDVTGEVRRVTLRLVEQIKDRAEEAASSNGVSLNAWLSQAVQGALREQMRKDRYRY